MRISFPSVQVWRLTGEESDEYKLLAGSERPIVYTPANVSRTGAHEYPLIPSVSVAPGDLIAISQPKDSESLVRCYSIDSNGFNSYKLNSGTTMEDLPPDGNRIIKDELVLIYPVTGRKIKYAIIYILYIYIIYNIYIYTVEYCRVDLLQSCMQDILFMLRS